MYANRLGKGSIPFLSSEKMAAADSVSKGKQVISIVSSSEDGSEEDEDEDEDEEDSDSWLGHADEEDDDTGDSSEGEEEDPDIRDEGYDDEEFEPDQEEDVESSEGSDEDEEYESISEDQSSEEDDDTLGDRREGKPNDEELCDRVINLLLRRNKNLDVLKLEECKAYLRKHELMISGTKATCIQRILEHWRLKDGNGERLYPKSSFTINCRGDVCKGDVVMFKQRVYEKFGKVLRFGKIIGKRTIAGRVVKESYGDAKQQHTFTIEVLWSKGVKPLPPLYPLLVKGRNLYRYTTFRQHWRNEAERSKVLEEKHRRGAIARHVRASTRAGISAGLKRQRGPSGSRQHHNKRLKKDSESAFRKKQQKISSSKAEANTCSNKKPTASASSAKYSKNHGAKIFSAAHRANTSSNKKPTASAAKQSKKHGAIVSSAAHRANTCSNKKLTASASSDKHSEKHGSKFSSAAHTKKLETKKPSASHSKKLKTKPSEAHYKNLSIKTPSCTHQRQDYHSGTEVKDIYCSPPSDLHRRNSIAAPPVGLERFHIPSYNHNPNISLATVPPHHFIGQPFPGHVYHRLDQRSHLGRPYLSSISQHASSRSSGHFFTPVVHDSRFGDLHFHGRRQH